MLILGSYFNSHEIWKKHKTNARDHRSLQEFQCFALSVEENEPKTQIFNSHVHLILSSDITSVTWTLQWVTLGELCPLNIFFYYPLPAKCSVSHTHTHKKTLCFLPAAAGKGKGIFASLVTAILSANRSFRATEVSMECVSSPFLHGLEEGNLSAAPGCRCSFSLQW